MSELRHPIQPLVTVNGVVRFKKNTIVRDLLDHASKHGFDLNVIALKGYSDDDQQHLAQLIGYSLSGYGGLPYASDEVYNAASETQHQEVRKPMNFADAIVKLETSAEIAEGNAKLQAKDGDKRLAKETAAKAKAFRAAIEELKR